jgi:hypothetical protein
MNLGNRFWLSPKQRDLDPNCQSKLTKPKKSSAHFQNHTSS